MDIAMREISVKNIITPSNIPSIDYAVNPYLGCTHACRYCYASFMSKFTNHTEPWGRFLDIKKWNALEPGKYRGKRLFFGTATDPYLPEERVYERTRSLLLSLRDSGAHIIITTKSDLILRDLELIASIPNVQVNWSINTLSEVFASDMDRASSINSRLLAMRTFYDFGVRVGCFISPIFPILSDPVAIIDCVKSQCNEILIENLTLRGSYKWAILHYIRTFFPKLFSLYSEVYLEENPRYFVELDLELEQFAHSLNLPYLRGSAWGSGTFGDVPNVINLFHFGSVKDKSRFVQKSRDSHAEASHRNTPSLFD